MHHLETVEKAGRMKRYKVASSRLATLLWFCRRPKQSAVDPLAEGGEGDAEELCSTRSRGYFDPTWRNRRNLWAPRLGCAALLTWDGLHSKWQTRPTSNGHDRRGAGGGGWPGICPGWRLPGREAGDCQSDVAWQKPQEEPPTDAVAAGGGATSDQGARMAEMRLEAGEAVGRGATARLAGELQVKVLCSGLGGSLHGEEERRHLPQRQGARCPRPPPRQLE
ncbi:hypothetical protein NDU88_005712 [Pleurodeles waltl]|uniref:Uncharacterized protein n=1 Tax=Pleurodeles waltl TaxID=8319 RepID=A0AAV7MX94_PLEWA|nr:hypothetical protein NDU88_005712 [Pleurodeles waltl]